MQRANSFQPPTRRHAGLDIAEEFEIPGEMIDRHGDQRDAARDVDGVDAPRRSAGARSACVMSARRYLVAVAPPLARLTPLEIR